MPKMPSYSNSRWPPSSHKLSPPAGSGDQQTINNDRPVASVLIFFKKFEKIENKNWSLTAAGGRIAIAA